MLLNKKNMPLNEPADSENVAEELFHLPERVLMFGTGVLLRGLPNYFIDKANKQGVFNGRVVMVKSTQQGSLDELAQQDFLYTLCICGVNKGEKVEENIINTSVSRIINAASAWHDVLACAGDKNISVIISNTTEVGIRYVAESIAQAPPQSFPGKLLAYLYERYKVFAGKRGSGCVIVPTELINDNGEVLKSILEKLAQFNNLGTGFINWLLTDNRFCNSLVDRIVPGSLSETARQEFEQEAGYEDRAAIMAEPYALWAIEGDEEVRQKLSFCEADKRVVITQDIGRYRELKLRLLNGTHTFSCALAFLKGIATVKEAMQDAVMKSFITDIMYDEIAPAIAYPLTVAEKEAFANDVADRFSNPFIVHQWLSISLNYTDKMKTRNVPLITHYISQYHHVPERMALGFAAFLRFMQPVQEENGLYYGMYKGNAYRINDPKAGFFYQLWQTTPAENAITEILKSEELWGAELPKLDCFAEAVLKWYERLCDGEA